MLLSWRLLSQILLKSLFIGISVIQIGNINGVNITRQHNNKLKQLLETKKLHIPFICFRLDAAETLQIGDHFESTHPQISAQAQQQHTWQISFVPHFQKKKNINDRIVSHTTTLQNPHLHLVTRKIKNKWLKAENIESKASYQITSTSAWLPSPFLILAHWHHVSMRTLLLCTDMSPHPQAHFKHILW